MQQRLDFSPTHMEWLSRNSTSGLSKGKKKKSCFVNVILCNQVSNFWGCSTNDSPVYHGFTKPVWKQQIIASRKQRTLRGRKMWNWVPICSAQEAARNPETWSTQGRRNSGWKPLEKSSWGSRRVLLSSPGPSHKADAPSHFFLPSFDFFWVLLLSFLVCRINPLSMVLFLSKLIWKWEGNPAFYKDWRNRRP